MGMHSFCGILMKEQVQPDRQMMHSMVNALGEERRFYRMNRGRFSLAVRDDRDPEKPDSKGLIYSDEDHVVAFNGRFDCDSAILSSDDSAEKKYIFKELYKYILKYIYSAPDKMRGDFVIVAYDKQNDRLTLIRDQLGFRPLYYTDQPGYFAFATEMKALKALPGISIEMDETWIADAVSTVKSEKWRTPYALIRRVLPGHRLDINNTLRETKYWDLRVKDEYSDLDYDEAVAVFREKMIQSVKNRIGEDQVLATELSGGLDSSGVTAVAARLAKQSGQSLFALTHAFSDQSLDKYFPYKDEREFSLAVIEYIGLKEQLFCDADGYGLLDRLKQNILVQSGPTQQGYSMFSDTLYDRGRDRGVTKLLSGFGGDEGVTSKAGGFFEELAQNGKWDLYRKEFMERSGAKGVRKLKRQVMFMLRRHTPFAHQFISDLRGRSDWRAEKYPGLGFTQEFGERMGIEKRFYERLGFPDDPNVRDRQYKRIMHDHVSQRLEYSFLDAKAYGIEYAYPLWDIDLIEFYYSLPAEYKFRNGMGRAIYRDAMEGVLPEKIRLRNDKTGATVPTVQQRFLSDEERITALIQRSRENNSYHYLDYDKMLAWQERMRKRGFNDKLPANPAAFFNSLQILLLQEMEREGTFRSGIRI